MFPSRSFEWYLTNHREDSLYIIMVGSEHMQGNVGAVQYDGDGDDRVFSILMDAPDYLSGQDNSLGDFNITDVRLVLGVPTVEIDGVEYKFSIFERVNLWLLRD